MILPFLYIAPTPRMGRGVFSAEAIPPDTIIEIAPVIVMSAAERILLDQTRLHDYIFEWGHEKELCCMALGYVPVYNHACPSNCEYEMDYDTQLITIKTMRQINADEELFINYNGDFDDAAALWFEHY